MTGSFNFILMIWIFEIKKHGSRFRLIPRTKDQTGFKKTVSFLGIRSLPCIQFFIKGLLKVLACAVLNGNIIKKRCGERYFCFETYCSCV
jgi:hypothetical protein